MSRRTVLSFGVMMVAAGLTLLGCPSGDTGLVVSHPSHDYGSNGTEFTFWVWSAGTANVSFTVSTDQTWLSASPTSGTSSGPDKKAAVKVVVDRSGLSTGKHTGTITVSSNAGTKNIPVTVWVSAASVMVSDSSHDFGYAEDMWQFSVWNGGAQGTSLTFNVATDKEWLTCTPNSGVSTGTSDPKTVTVSIDRDALSKASYTGTITVTSPQGGIQTISISARDPEAAIAVSSELHDFGYAETEWTFSVWNVGQTGSTLDFQVAANQDWISLNPATGGSTGPGDAFSVTVTIDRAAATAKRDDFEGEITVSSEGLDSRTITVRGHRPDPTIGLSHEVLILGGSDTERQFDVWNQGDTGSVLDFTVSSEQTWMTFDPASESSVGSWDQKTVTVTVDRAAATAKSGAAAEKAVGDGYRTTVGSGGDKIDVVVVKGTPYEMGRELGELMYEEIDDNCQAFLAYAYANGAEENALRSAWEIVSDHIDDRFLNELQGVADGLVANGATTTLDELKWMHMVPVLDTYNCSAVALWGPATADSHLYQIRNLDWDTGTTVEDNPWVVVYVPDVGTPHANIGFAGMLGSIAGINANGIALSEIGNSPSSDQPFEIDGEHFSTMFRRILYDADGMTTALDMLSNTQRIKRYHYVFGDGRNEMRGVKIKAHAPELPPNDLIIWEDNAADDPVIAEGLGVREGVVYYAGGRNYKVYADLLVNYGTYNADKTMALSRAVAMYGINVMNVVYDATSLEVWMAFLEDGTSEAYQREFVHLDLRDFLVTPANSFEGTITVAGEGTGARDILVLGRLPEPEIARSPAVLDFGGVDTDRTFDVWNGGEEGSSLDFNVTSEDAWISVTPTSQTSADVTDPQTVTVSINRSAIPVSKSTYFEGHVTIWSPGLVSKRVTITGRFPEPEVGVSHAILDYGTAAVTATLTVSNIGEAGSLLSFTASKDKDWITLSTTAGTDLPVGGAGQDIVVTIDRTNLSKSTSFSGVITITPDTPDASAKTVIVSVESIQPIVGMAPASLDYGATQTVLTLDVWNAGDAGTTLTYTMTPSVPWLTLDVNSGVSTGAGVVTTHTATIDRTALASLGSYTAEIVIDATGIAAVACPVTVEMVGPTAEFTIDPTTARIMEEVDFTDESVAGSGAIVSRVWTFGDGYGSIEQNPTHAYEITNQYDVSLKVTDIFGFTHTKTVENGVSIVAGLPHAEFSISDSTAFQYERIDFTNLSTPGAGQIAVCEWDFGDGTTSTSLDAHHSYSTRGEYTITLRITNSLGKSDETYQTIVIDWIVPDAQFSVDKSIVYSEIDDLTCTNESDYVGSTPPLSVNFSFWNGVFPEPGFDFWLTHSAEWWDSSTATFTRSDGLRYEFFDQEIYHGRMGVSTQAMADIQDPYTWGDSSAFYAGGTKKRGMIEVREPADLDKYVRLEDTNYEFTNVATIESQSSDGIGYTAYILEMVSQKWRIDDPYIGAGEPGVSDPADNIWWHWLTIIVPDNYDESIRTSLLYVDGGDSDGPGVEAMPIAVEDNLATFATRTGAIVCRLQMVPNQPITFSDYALPLSDWDLFGYTFDKFLYGTLEHWPILFPMVKATVRAMDTVESFLGGQGVGGPWPPLPVGDFVLAGASEQAWSNWLTAAHDSPRVRGVIPIAFELFDICGQRDHQRATLGHDSEAWDAFITPWDVGTGPHQSVFDALNSPLQFPANTTSGLGGSRHIKQYRKLLEHKIRAVLYDIMRYAANEQEGQNIPVLANYLLHMEGDTLVADWNMIDNSYPYLQLSASAQADADQAWQYLHKDSSYWENPGGDAKYEWDVIGLVPMCMGNSGFLYGGLLHSVIDEWVLKEEEIRDDPATRGELLAYDIDPDTFDGRYNYSEEFFSEFGGRLNMPSLQLNATNDAYFMSDSSFYYFGTIDGDQFLRYFPNTGHDLVGPGVNGYTEALLTAIPWFVELIEEGHVSERFEFTVLGEGLLEIQLNDGAVAPDEVNLWIANSRDRDFRKDVALLGPDWAGWDSQAVGPVTAGASQYLIELERAECDYKAFFVELVYPDEYGVPVVYNTTIQVIPPRYDVCDLGPVGDFEATPLMAAIGADVTFVDQSDENEETINSWEWDFGDGNTGTGSTVTHQYAAEGTYTVTLRVDTLEGSTFRRVKYDYITVIP